MRFSGVRWHSPSRNAIARSHVLEHAGPKEAAARTHKCLSGHQRAQHRIVRGSGIMPFGLALGISMVWFATASGVAHAEAPKGFADGPSSVLRPGWNLITLPRGFESERSGLELQMWPADGFAIPESSEATNTRPSPSALDPGHGVWVHSTQRRVLNFSEQAEWTQTSSVHTGWNLLSVSRPTQLVDPNIHRVLEWNPEQSRYLSVPVGTDLMPGVGYWALAFLDGAFGEDSCVPQQWQFSDAVQVLDNCSLGTDSTGVVARSRWSFRKPDADSRVTDASFLVLHHTATAKNESVVALEERIMVKASQPDLPYHFVIAQNDEGRWQIYEGRQLGIPLSLLFGSAVKLPPEVHIAIMGTYEAVDAASYEQTRHGHAPWAGESLRQPPVEAVLRLGDLVAALSARQPSIKRLIPYSQGPEAHRPGSGLSPGKGTLHLLDALNTRFFPTEISPPEEGQAAAVEDLDSERTAEDEDTKPPLLRLFSPAHQDFETEELWLVLEGTVDDAFLEGLYVNGVRVQDASANFVEIVELAPGNNHIELVAVDESGNTRRIEKRVTYIGSLPEESTEPKMDTPPSLELFGADEGLQYTREATWSLAGKAQGENLSGVFVNGVLLSTSAGPFSFPSRLGPGRNAFHVVAKGRTSGLSEAKLTVVLDERPPEISVTGGSDRTVLGSSFNLSGLVSEPHLQSLILRRPKQTDGEPLKTEDGFFHKELRLHEGENRWVIEAADKAGHVTVQLLTISRDTNLEVLTKPAAPTQLFGANADQSVTLVWTAPTHFEDGSEILPGVDVSYRIYRAEVLEAGTHESEAPLQETTGGYFQENVPAYGVYFYKVQSVVYGKNGQEAVSALSEPIKQSVLPPLPVLNLGEFEPPTEVDKTGGMVVLPKFATVHQDDVKHVHGAYVVRGDGTEGDSIAYIHSVQGGREGTFFRPVDRIDDRISGTVIDLALAASEDRVSLGFIERTDAGHPSFRIHVLELKEEGVTRDFVKAWSGDPSTSQKRELSMAIDRLGHHHMVWSESNKIYYAKNFKVEVDPNPSKKGRADPRLSVFDVHRRMPAIEPVRSLVKYEPVDGACACKECWCEDSYLLRDEPNPDRDGAPFGEYVDWWHETFTYAPSLHVDDQRVMIVAHQTRLWDNEPVMNDAWVTMMAAPIYSSKEIQRRRLTRLTVGWRKTWKHAYEPGDELLWKDLGFETQYLYSGSWFEEDQIKVAQRPLEAGAWSRPEEAVNQEGVSGVVERGFKQGAWKDGTEDRWRIAVVDTLRESRFDNRPSTPKVAKGPKGTLYVVYEKGPSSDAHALPGNGLYFSKSRDGGSEWSPPEPLMLPEGPSLGYLPDLAVSSSGDLLVVAVRPEQGAITPTLVALKSRDDGASWVSVRLNEDHHRSLVHPVLPVHWPRGENQAATESPEARYADTYNWVPEIQVEGSLIFVPFLRQTKDGADHNQLMTTRASWDNTVQKIATSGGGASLVQGQSVTTNLRIVNADDVAVYGGQTVSDSETGPTLGAHTQIGLAPQSNFGAAFRSPSISFFDGQAQIATTSLAEVPAFWNDQHADEAAKRRPGNVSGNHFKAIEERKALTRTVDLGTLVMLDASSEHYYFHRFPPTDKTATYQVEYHLDAAKERAQDEMRRLLSDALWESPEYKDAKHLAGFGRVWAYTLGIALAQAARASDFGEQERAQGLARYLCAYAVLDRKRPDELKGWHFSWNTEDDTWRDARLVTGATAWALHGLGVFMSSSAFANLKTDKAWFRGCYQKSLRGLSRHRRRIEWENGQEVSLMTAGWTTRGLRNAARPSSLGLTSDPQERWAYYTILDAVGYDAFDPSSAPQVKVCNRGETCFSHPIQDDTWWAWRSIDEQAWRVLGREDEALNVVTEHNLDTLSVLNHALSHAALLGLDETTDLHQEFLEEWRDELRDGIFQALWDEDGWVDEMGAALDSAPTEEIAEEMRRALESKEPLGRVITGGGDVVPLSSSDSGSETRYRWDDRSNHSAIDNCSWLSLSVDYPALETGRGDGVHSDYVQKLARCLEYTTLLYVKPLGFCSSKESTACPETASTYTGTHYFQNAFRDPYIEPSELQQSSYHLEATMGLIAGLMAFAKAHPEHARSSDFERTARTMWKDAQKFVRTHGFPYSSQRIQNLSTLLSSSTAIVWFLDVYAMMKASDSDFNRPLQHYASDVDIAGLGLWLEGSYPGILDLEIFFSPDDAGADIEDGPTLVNSGEQNGRAYTLVEDQALALLVSLEQGDGAAADRWLGALLKVLSANSGDSDSGPYAVDSRTGEPLLWGSHLDVQLFGLYAVGRYLEHHPLAEEHALRSAAEAAYLARLRALGKHHLQKTHPGLLFGDAVHARIDDNVLWYFNLELASRLWGAPFDLWRSRTKEQLAPLCWSSEQEGPLDFVSATGATRAAQGPSTFALCALFYQSQDHLREAQIVLDALAFLSSAEEEHFGFEARTKRASQPPPFGIPLQADDFSLRWTSLGGEAFARRGLSRIDPRQDNLALLALARLRRLEGQVPDALLHGLTYLLDTPGGFLGLSVGASLVTGKKASPVRTAKDWLAIEKSLSRQYLDTLTALLSSDFRPYRFDALFRALVRIRFALEQISTASRPRPLSPKTWSKNFRETFYDELVRRSVYDLSNFCTHAEKILGETHTFLDYYIGFPASCGVVQESAQNLLDARQGHTAGSLFETLGYDENAEALAFDVLIKSLDMSSGPYMLTAQKDNTGTASDLPHQMRMAAPLIEWPPHASMTEVKELIRQRLKSAVRSGIQNQTGQLAYELEGIDSIAAFHPESPGYWRFVSIALRTAMAGAFQADITFTAGGAPSGAPSGFLATAEAARRRALRHFINEFGDGHLPKVASRASMQPAWLHRLLRTGHLTATDFERLLGDHNGWPEEMRTRWLERLAPASDQPPGSESVGRLSGFPAHPFAFATPSGGPREILKTAAVSEDTLSAPLGDGLDVPENAGKSVFAVLVDDEHQPVMSPDERTAARPTLIRFTLEESGVRTDANLLLVYSRSKEPKEIKIEHTHAFVQIDSTVTISGDPEGETTAAEELRVELDPALIPKNLGDEIYDVIHFKDAVTGETLDRVLVRTNIRTLAPIEMPTVTPEVLDFEIPDSGNEPICRSFSVFGKSLSAISWRTHEGFVFHAQHGPEGTKLKLCILPEVGKTLLSVYNQHEYSQPLLASLHGPGFRFTTLPNSIRLSWAGSELEPAISIISRQDRLHANKAIENGRGGWCMVPASVTNNLESPMPVRTYDFSGPVTFLDGQVDRALSSVTLEPGELRAVRACWPQSTEPGAYDAHLALAVGETSRHFRLTVDGFVGIWPLDGDTVDATQNHNAGQFLIEDPPPQDVFPAGVRGRGYAPSSAPGGYGTFEIENHTATQFEGLDALTVSVWVKPDADFRDDGVIIGNRSGREAEGWELRILNDRRVEFSVAQSRALSRNVVSTKELPAHEWSHVVAGWDGEAREIMLYVNSRLEFRANFEAAERTREPLSLPKNGRLVVGGLRQNGTFGFDGASYLFPGVLDELSLYRGLWSEELIQFHYQTVRSSSVINSNLETSSDSLLSLLGLDNTVTKLDRHEEAEVIHMIQVPKFAGQNVSKGFFGMMKTFLSAEPKLAAGAMAVALPAGYVFTAENDLALKTMVVFDSAPSPAWVEVGSVAAENVMLDVGRGAGLTAFFLDEEQIRRGGGYEAIDGTTQLFDDKAIYGFDIRHMPDLVPIDALFPKGGTGAAGFAKPDLPKYAGQNGRVKIFVLDTDRSLDEIVDTFLMHHSWWHGILSIANYFPHDAARAEWLRTMEGFLLGWFFNTTAAELAAGIHVESHAAFGFPSWWVANPRDSLNVGDLQVRPRETIHPIGPLPTVAGSNPSDDVIPPPIQDDKKKRSKQKPSGVPAGVIDLLPTSDEDDVWPCIADARRHRRELIREGYFYEKKIDAWKGLRHPTKLFENKDKLSNNHIKTLYKDYQKSLACIHTYYDVHDYGGWVERWFSYPEKHYALDAANDLFEFENALAKDGYAKPPPNTEDKESVWQALVAARMAENELTEHGYFYRKKVKIWFGLRNPVRDFVNPEVLEVRAMREVHDQYLSALEVLRKYRKEHSRDQYLVMIPVSTGKATVMVPTWHDSHTENNLILNISGHLLDANSKALKNTEKEQKKKK